MYNSHNDSVTGAAPAAHGRFSYVRFEICSNRGSQYPGQLLILTACPLRVQVSQGLCPLFQVEFFKTDRPPSAGWEPGDSRAQPQWVLVPNGVVPPPPGRGEVPGCLARDSCADGSKRQTAPQVPFRHGQFS